MKIKITVETEYFFNDDLGKWKTFYPVEELVVSFERCFRDTETSDISLIGKKTFMKGYSHPKFGSIVSFGSIYNTNRFQKHK